MRRKPSERQLRAATILRKYALFTIVLISTCFFQKSESFIPHPITPRQIPSTYTASCSKCLIIAQHYPHFSSRCKSLSLRGTAVTAEPAISSNDGERKIIALSIITGLATAIIGFLYGKFLNLGVYLLWKRLPSRFPAGSINPTLFITSVCTLGGLLIGILSKILSTSYSVADFVTALSSVPAEEESLPSANENTNEEYDRLLPPSRSSLLPLLLLSLITSTFGFSVGPEAPMVGAGGLIGSSIARRFNITTPSSRATLAYAGAAGCLTAFMGIPIAGSLFALEMTRRGAGMATDNDISGKSVSGSVAASVAALFLIRFVLSPVDTVGGHFAYGSVGALSSRKMIATALAAGCGGGVLGTVFHKVLTWFKARLWKAPDGGKGSSSKRFGAILSRDVAIKTGIGLAVGLLSASYPQTLFWGEGSLQCVIDGQRTAFAATHHGLTPALTAAARVNPDVAFGSAWGAPVQVALAKFVAIILACAGKFPGGIIFPLFFAAAPLAHAFAGVCGGSVVSVLVMCLMASTQASVTRTPLATAFILTLSASAGTEMSVMLPACLISSYVGVWFAQMLSRNSYFKYSSEG